MKLPFINENIFKPHKNPVERGDTLHAHDEAFF